MGRRGLVCVPCGLPPSSIIKGDATKAYYHALQTKEEKESWIGPPTKKARVQAALVPISETHGSEREIVIPSPSPSPSPSRDTLCIDASDTDGVDNRSEQQQGLQECSSSRKARMKERKRDGANGLCCTFSMARSL